MEQGTRSPLPNPELIRVSSSWIELSCPEPSPEYELAARTRQDELTKPKGALGALETIAITLAGLQGTAAPRAGVAPIVLFAGDHGITSQGVSAYPSAVTVEMLRNFARGGAAVSVLAKELGVPLVVVDAGTLATTPIEGVIQDKPRAGARDFSLEPALTPSELDQAFEVGRRQVLAAARGADLVLFGEMGIGNTTSAAAIAAALLREDPARIAGAGTGLDSRSISRKAEIIGAALRLHLLDRPDVAPRRVLEAVGGLEIAALAGAIIAAAQSRIPVLIDGFIVSAAALAATRLNPSCRPWLLFSHASAEQGHRRILAALSATPILDLGLRLGEGTGAVTALSVVRLACALHNGMATFAEASVSGRDPPCP